MRKLGVVFIGVALFALTSNAALASSRIRISAHIEAPDLAVHLTQHGLTPGQNYGFYITGSDYVTFYCYRDKTFTPTRRSRVVLAPYNAVINLVAQADGSVSGSTVVSPSAVYPTDLCLPKQTVVAVSVTYNGVTVQNIVTGEYADLAGPWTSPIEPD